MDIKPLDDRLYVTAQPRLDELEQLAEQGFRTIISNRPRGKVMTSRIPMLSRLRQNHWVWSGMKFPSSPASIPSRTLPPLPMPWSYRRLP
ncbi:hypothetical protein HSBAA_PA_3130 (plasmid) [Vreelandella sulfidaeris]|uniref:Uncharacterized protein n=1 Tax=Vreelandella sulfidaeris TaxID=115553 RepID=A0A455UHK9_9GAMM|nr:hypothetical protein HSBAA_PA_3130 [Halomonas sulfidaeris]